MSSSRRAYQIADKIRSSLAMELQRVADPRFHLVTITSVIMSPDLRNAKIYWVVSNSDSERVKEVTKAFEGAAGLMKRHIGKDLGTKFIPELKFYYDETLDTSEAVTELLTKANGGSHS